MSDTRPSATEVSGIRPAGSWARTLEAIVRHCNGHDVVRKHELAGGDRVLVRTRNSLYSLLSLGDGTFAVSGGWFDRNSRAPVTMAVNGCTYGGSAILHDVVAGPGLFLEFGNRVSTTRIQEVRVLRTAEGTGPAALPN